MKRLIYHKRRQIKIGIIVLIALVVISAGVMTLSYQGVIALVLPIFEGAPFAPSPVEEYVPDQIIVKFKPGTTVEAVNQLNQSLGTEVVQTSTQLGFKVLQIPEGKTVAEMVAIYSEQSIVEYAEPNYIDRILPEAK